ncbi:hypothetical protein M378DRAFT_275109 [Amanita muscaria Koide BX008]|uniref:Uncharacterized protein n=1 Tax=Amanita muscaria (strain Koide BX008) TaxID=946122 RepID=A0A0C2WS43_AMAMK|nr:hypothetical protein M378DRAFT_275109 [Amanita muscaria Koide BX008]
MSKITKALNSIALHFTAMSVTTNILGQTMSMLEMYRSPPCLTSSGCCPCAKRRGMRQGSRWNVCRFLSRSVDEHNVLMQPHILCLKLDGFLPVTRHGIRLCNS